MFEKKVIDKYLWLLMLIFISGTFLIISNTVFYDIVALLTLVFGAMLIVNFDIAHPFVWFSFIFALYSISYPLFYMYGLTYDIYTYSHSLMITQWLALSTLLLVIGPTKTNYKLLKQLKVKLISNKIITGIISVFLLITIITISTGNYTHKNQIYESGSFITTFGFSLAYIFLICFALTLTQKALTRETIDRRATLIAFVFIFLLVYFSGERDLILRFIVIVFFVYYIIVKKSKLTKEIIIFGVMGLSAIPFLKEFKYFGLTGERNESELNIFFDFLSSDFLSASKNLQTLIADPSAYGKFGGETIISDFVRAFKLEKLFNYEAISSIEWFNKYYFKEGRAGQGFTLVGEGYVNFGYFGIVLIFIILGVIIKFLYYKSNQNIYYFSFYIVSIPIFMYSIRADLANVLSPLINQIFLTFILFKVANNFLSRKSIN